MKSEILTFKEIDSLAEKVAKNLKPGNVLGLTGGLGTGKTTFTKNICKHLGIKENVKSPTFNYVIEYTSGRIPVYHFDVYRFSDASEIYEIGFEDYINDTGAAIIEWADKIEEELPGDTIFIKFEYNNESSRKISTYKMINGVEENVDIWD